ncbi:putative endo-beta-1,6-glucanase [Xylogone sp. PMI_703]|nr:putative endo-beta-1,6-glucanase [Xylogone sp. PMI_703]
MHMLTVLFLALPAFTSAWMPEVNKVITSTEGHNHFRGNVSVAGRRWLPGTLPIRGVNLGSMFVFEPWIAGQEWNRIQCGPYKSEFDCVSGLGQAKANSVFQDHWNTWITQADIQQMKSYGLNTIRIPLGYWMDESLVYSDSEHFPQGGLTYLERVCGWASDAGFYIILDLHGAPGAQVATNPDTGQNAPSPGFYVNYQFDRAISFLGWLARIVHTNNNYRNVGMIEIVNEPVQNANSVGAMRSYYYPKAFDAIRNVENSLGITSNNQLHIQMMNNKWGSGDPTQYLTNNWFAAYDDHRYLKWDTSVPVSQSSYISTSCHDDRGGNWPTIVGEWSISVPDNVEKTAPWDVNTQKAFYKKWFAAQVMAYEKQDGWIFWTWKTQLGDDYRWSYQGAVAAGVIPTDLSSVYNMGAC